MANSIISKGLNVTSDPLSFSPNTSLFTIYNWASRKYGNMVQLRIALATNSTTNAGTSVTVGTLSGSLPAITTYILAFRESGELQCGTVVLPTSQGADIILNALTSIPSGVVIMITGTYICA